MLLYENKELRIYYMQKPIKELEDRTGKDLLYLQAPVLGDTSPSDDVLSSVR